MSKSERICLPFWFASLSYSACSAAVSLVTTVLELGVWFRHRLGINQLVEVAERWIFRKRRSRTPGGHEHTAADETQGWELGLSPTADEVTWGTRYILAPIYFWQDFRTVTFLQSIFYDFWSEVQLNPGRWEPLFTWEIFTCHLSLMLQSQATCSGLNAGQQ